MICFQPAELMEALCRNHVEFVVIGGIAAAIHGLARATYDLDIAYRHSSENCERLAVALQPFKPYLRDFPTGLPFHFDKQTIYQGSNFTLTTSLGDIDVFAEVPGAHDFDDLLNHSVLLDAFGWQIRCVNLDKLIHLKRSAGRPRDFEVLAQLEALRRDFGS